MWSGHYESEVIQPNLIKEESEVNQPDLNISKLLNIRKHPSSKDLQ